MTAVDTYLERLDKVKKNGQGWMALCPCHDDHHPSLSISVNDKGDVLLNCFACDASGIDVANRLGLTPATLFASHNGHRDVVVIKPSEKTPQSGITKGYERLHQYADADGTVTHAQAVYRKRDGDKIVKPWTKVGDRKFVNAWKGPRVLYRLPELDASTGTRFYLEGEKDVDTAYELGLSGVTTNPFGTQSCQHRDLDLSPLYGSDLLVIVGDNDDAGRRFADKQATHFASHGVPVKVIDLGLDIEGGDFTDWVEAGGTLKQFLELVEATPIWDAPDDAEDDLPKPLDFTNLGAADDEDWAIEPVAPTGKRTNIFSKAGEGKSLLSLAFAAHAATGKPILRSGRQPPIHVVYFDYEMTVGDVTSRLEAMGFDYEHDQVIQQHLHYYQMADIGPFDTEHGAHNALRIVGKHQATMVVIDTVSSVVSGAENDNDTYKRFSRLLTAKLANQGVTVITLDHAGKDETRGARGTSAKNDIADVVLNLKRTDTGDFTLKRVKGRQAWIPELVGITVDTADGLTFTMPAEMISAKASSLVRDMARLDVPLDLGRPKVRDILKAAGIEARNTDLSEAIRWRKRHPQEGQEYAEEGRDRTSGQGPQKDGGTGTGTAPAGNGGNVDTARAGQVLGTGRDSTVAPGGDSSPPLKGGQSTRQRSEEDNEESSEPCPSCGHPLNEDDVCANQAGQCTYWGWTRADRERREGRS